jgi:D-beta-D-heptose 7-phosphate kinase/D-beta-D-heptose 1-phosphate adenosyltransferase
MPKNEKILTRAQIRSISAHLHQAGRKIVFTNGCFDILHVGHLELLETARSYGDVLIVGVNTDDSIRRLKGKKRPINDQNDRARLLAALEVVDYVVLFTEDTPQKLIAEIMPQVLVKGGDYTPETIVGRETVESNGGVVIVFPLIKGKSSSALIDKIFQL